MTFLWNDIILNDSTTLYRKIYLKSNSYIHLTNLKTKCNSYTVQQIISVESLKVHSSVTFCLPSTIR